jgi:glycosyltransferase involved in cell wall biosynthesis
MNVTALICVRDGQDHLADALLSAQAQTLAPAEVVVIDDGSTDASAAIARSHGARVVQQPPLGLGAARNAAIRACRTDMAAFLDADDLWVPNKLELQAAAFAADPELDVCFGHACEFADGGGTGAVARTTPRPAPFSSTLCARKDTFLRVGGFDEVTRVGEVMGWLLRAREAGLREAMLPEVVTHRRVHGRNMTRTRRDEFGDYARMLKASLDRRKESA